MSSDDFEESDAELLHDGDDNEVGDREEFLFRMNAAHETADAQDQVTVGFDEHLRHAQAMALQTRAIVGDMDGHIAGVMTDIASDIHVVAAEIAKHPERLLLRFLGSLVEQSQREAALVRIRAALDSFEQGFTPPST